MLVVIAASLAHSNGCPKIEITLFFFQANKENLFTFSNTMKLTIHLMDGFLCPPKYFGYKEL